MTTADYQVQFGDRPVTTRPTADLLGAWAEAQVVVRNYTARLNDILSPSRDQLVDELMEWLESDSLDWDAVARARHEGW